MNMTIIIYTLEKDVLSVRLIIDMVRDSNIEWVHKALRELFNRNLQKECHQL